MKTLFVLLGLMIADVSWAQRGCTFSTEEINAGTARCEIHADKLKPIYREECSTTTCTGPDGDYSCESCSDVFVGYEVIGQFHYVKRFFASEPLKTKSNISFYYDQDNNFSKTIDKADNIFYGVEDLGTEAKIIQQDLSQDYLDLENSVKELRYSKITKDIELVLNDRTDFKNLNLTLQMRKRENSYDAYCYSYGQQTSCTGKVLDTDKILKTFDYVETTEGEKVLSGNYLEIMNKYFPKRRPYTDINDRKVYFELTIQNKLPAFKDPIAPEKYIKKKVLKYNGKKLK